MRLNESRCQKWTATNEFAFLALNPPLQLVAGFKGYGHIWIQ